MKIRDVIDALQDAAPLVLQEGWDNSGIQIGNPDMEVTRVLLCLDIDENIVEEAKNNGCNLIVSHHPLLFHPLRKITGENYTQRIVINAISNGISIVSMHTNMDSARNGVNFKLADKMGLTHLRFAEEKITDGHVNGMCVIGEYADPLSSEEFVAKLKTAFDVKCVQCNQPLNRGIKKVAVCGGAGSCMLDTAIKAGADAFVTGEMHYHEYFGHDQELQIAVIGHYQSEKFTTEVFKSIIQEKCKGVECRMAQSCTNPIYYL